MKRVMRDVTEYINKGEIYSSKHLYLQWSPDKLLIPPDSDEYQIVGNCMEDGHGLIENAELVNKFSCVK